MAKIRIKSRYLVIGVVVAALFLPGYLKFMQLAARNMYLEHEIRRLERENVKLYKEKKRLQEDMNYVEKVARDSMGVTRKGEIPIKIER